MTRLMTDNRQTKKKCSEDSGFKHTGTNELIEDRWGTERLCSQRQRLKQRSAIRGR